MFYYEYTILSIYDTQKSKFYWLSNSMFFTLRKKTQGSSSI